jgi:hypothetical protein
MHVTVDSPARVFVRPVRSMTKTDFTKALRVRSLFDTYAAIDPEPKTSL